MTSRRVLITGGTGLIGTHLSSLLTRQGYEVIWLSRSPLGKEPYKTYAWDVKKGVVDQLALGNLYAVVHLAGAGVADKRWSDERKQLILKSRTESTKLLLRELAELDRKPEVFVGASAIGFYGADTGDAILSEDSAPGSDFLAEVVKAWEASSAPLEATGIRRVLIRVGVVLSSDGGALPQLLAPLKWGLGAPLGSGNQWMSWIHINDLCRIFAEALGNDSYQGIYNAVAPNPATNRELTRASANVLRRPLWLPAVPAFVLKLMLGEMAQIVLGGNKVSCGKVRNEGFAFDFPELEEALKDLLAG